MKLAVLLFILSTNLVFGSLKEELNLQTRSTHVPINYKEANRILFTILDNKSGQICSLYSPDECIYSDTVPSPKIMNVEHTWPQSEGANGDAKSDLHHLFATSSSTNSMRSSLPFCVVELVKWTNGFCKRGMSKFNEHCFEPPLDQRGNIARAIFYFSIRYDKSIDANQEYYLRAWHKEDPVDEAEMFRMKVIERYQKNSNPFILHPELVEMVNDF
jgi:hypothetical protein